MKFVFMLLVLGLTLTSIAGKNFEFKFGNSYDILGKHITDYDNVGTITTFTGDTSFGVSPYAEILGNKKNFSLGVGASYQIPRSMTNEVGSSKFSFIPVYVTMSLKVSPQSVITPEIIGHAGYNFLSVTGYYPDDCKQIGGVYYGIGAGLRMDMFILQLMYKVNEFELTYEYPGGDPDYEWDNDFYWITNKQLNITLGASIF